MTRVLVPLLLLVGTLGSTGWAEPKVPGAVEARADRRARLATLLGEDYALVLGRPLSDVEQPRQEGHFLYLAGVDEPSASLLLAGKLAPALALKVREGTVETHEVLMLRAANPRFAQFFGLRHRVGKKTAKRLGVELTRPAPGNGAKMAKLLAEHLPKGAGLRIPLYRGPDRADVREIRRAIAEALAQTRPDVTLLDLHRELSAMRAVKDHVELDLLRSAIAITEEAMRVALPQIRVGSSEPAVEAALMGAVRGRGARPAYPFVVASGINATVPHYFRNESPLQAGELLLIDAGASMDRYAADITRVFPISGEFTERQRQVYENVLEAQLAGIAAVRPGASLTDVDKAARKVLSDAGLAKYFIHGTCHHVGLDVHDPGPSLIEVGMTFTVEPGVYIEKEKLGIRIEDVVLVTEEGCEVLTRGIPKDVAGIEALVSAK